MGTQDPVKTARAAVSHAKDHGNDFVLLDTAGRLHIDEELMDELRLVKAAVEPTDILLVVDAMTGQDAVNVAKSFDELLDISGVILTKLDGDTRGGAALSVRAVTGKPIKFAGVGEKLEDIEAFHPDRMASRILGMGDVLSLIEDVESKLDQKKGRADGPEAFLQPVRPQRPARPVPAGQADGTAEIGASKLPGMEKKLQNVDVDDRQMDRTCAIIPSP